jgi:hypothetical protein
MRIIHLALDAIEGSRRRRRPKVRRSQAAAITGTVILLCFSVLTFSQTPAGWQPTQDPNHLCQIAFPPTWEVTNPPDGQAKAPEGTEAVVVVGSSKRLEPLSAEWQKLYLVDRLIENTPLRVFYVTKPVGDTVQYIIDQQFAKTRCQAQIKVWRGHSENEVIQIAKTLAPLD